MKKLITITLTILLLGLETQAQPWYLSMRPEFESLIVENQGSDGSYIYITGPIDPSATDPSQNEEESFYIEPKTKVSIPLDSKKKWSWLQLKSYENLKLNVSVKTNKETLPLMSGRSNTISPKTQRLQPQGGEIVLQVTNLSPIEQEAHLIQNFASQKKEVGLVKLSKFETKSISLSVDRVSSLQVEAEYPISGIWIRNQAIQILQPKKSLTKFTTSTEVKFLMSNLDRSQSFIFSTQDLKLIQAAREQIQFPNKHLPRVFIATIQKGHGNLNRDLASLQSPWSWSVKEALQFSEFGHQSCDGSPQLVEDFLIPWLESSASICFWNYRVVEELQTQLAP